MPNQIFKYFLIVLILYSLAFSQTGTYFNQRDDQYTLLGLKRAKEAYDMSKKQFDRIKDMFDNGLTSQQELDNARNIMTDAEVNYQQSLLAVLFENQYVGVENAVKYQSKTGQKRVKITLANTSGGTAEFKKLLNIDDDLYNALQPETVHDVYVSLLNDDNAIISQPYEAKIEQLLYGKPITLDFGLLQDVDAVTVNLLYSNGSQRSPKIFLQKDESENKVIVQSEQFSQEVELGESASLDLTLELFSAVNNTFKLLVVNLPKQINHYFMDPASQARLSQFKFTESTNTRQAALQVFMPDRPSDEIVIDQAIPFYVLAVPRNMISEFNDSDKIWNDKELEALNIGYVRLELVPRGVGKLLVRAPMLYFSIKPEEQVSFNIELINEGSRRLDNIKVEADTPMNWDKSIDPELTPSLEIGNEKQTRITLTPTKEISTGRYEFRIKSTSLSDNRPVYGEEKTVIVQVEARSNTAGTLIIILFILIIISVIIYYGIRLSRR